jgi:cytochrome c peroxidase
VGLASKSFLRPASSAGAALVVFAALALAGCLTGGNEKRERFEPPSPPAGWPRIEWPADNPYHPAKAELGRRLFFDPGLSSTGVVSCSWCHSERASFADNHSEPFSTGVRLQPTRRNTPTIVNVAFGTSFLLDGEVATLEEQALRPLLSPEEMDMTGPEIIARVAGDSAYSRLFREGFGNVPVTLQGVAKALATYERTLISFHAPYDRWKAGDESALSSEARRGEALFTGKAGCARCHVPPLFTDGKYHNTGLDAVTADSGRARVTRLAADLGKFKTPTLRNLQWTHPFMHDGRFFELREVLEHYNEGGAAHPARDSLLRPLGLSYAETEDLRAFLESLTDQRFVDEHVIVH